MNLISVSYFNMFGLVNKLLIDRGDIWILHCCYFCHVDLLVKCYDFVSRPPNEWNLCCPLPSYPSQPSQPIVTQPSSAGYQGQFVFCFWFSVKGYPRIILADIFVSLLDLLRSIRLEIVILNLLSPFTAQNKDLPIVKEHEIISVVRALKYFIYFS